MSCAEGWGRCLHGKNDDVSLAGALVICRHFEKGSVSRQAFRVAFQWQKTHVLFFLSASEDRKPGFVSKVIWLIASLDKPSFRDEFWFIAFPGVLSESKKLGASFVLVLAERLCSSEPMDIIAPISEHTVVILCIL